MKVFEQAILSDPHPDTVIYDIRKFFSLAIDNNPNLIEVLHADESDYIYTDEIGEEILAHKNDFLSKKIRYSFSGYAISQLKRIKTHRKYILNPVKDSPTRKSLGLPEETLIPKDQLAAVSADIQKELDKFHFHFIEGLEDSVKIGIKSIMSEMLAELKISTEDQWLSSARKIGLSDNFIEIMQKERQYSNAKREFDQYQNWKKTRNTERYAMEEKFGFDCKHALHLVRLLRMCKEALTTGKIIVKRPDREELLSIRNGEWSYDKLIEYAENEEKAISELYLTSKLPKAPNKEKLDKLCISLIEKSLNKYSLYNIKKYFR